MKKFWDYIDEHVWAQWVFSLAVCVVLGVIVDKVYPLIHPGDEWEVAFRAWLKGEG